MRIKEVYKTFSKGTKTVATAQKQLCGSFLGSGAYRDVYIFKPDDRFVIKIERDISRGNFANVCEWRNYINNKDWVSFCKWLAPCEAITPDGRILLQWRVQREIDDIPVKYPAKIPSLFTDTKRANFGMLNGRLVCCDYSFLVSCDFKMKKAKWW